MGKLHNTERLSDGLNNTIKQSKKVYKLTQYTYQQLVKMIENPSNIKPVEDALFQALKAEKEEENKARGREFNKPAKVIKMPRISRDSDAKAV